MELIDKHFLINRTIAYLYSMAYLAEGLTLKHFTSQWAVNSSDLLIWESRGLSFEDCLNCVTFFDSNVFL